MPVRRMVFHEITQAGDRRALDETRGDRRSLVDAQEARRILDRLYGYEVSPVLWRKMMQGLSAGRVQSVATRLVVERERERMRVRRGRLLGHRRDVRSGRVRRAPRPPSTAGGVAQGRDFGPDGKLRRRRRAPLGEDDARSLADALDGAAFAVSLGRGEAVQAPPGRAVHDLDAAAGGQPQASLHGSARRCGSRSVSTRTATSPTCAPTRPRCRRPRSRRPATRPASSTAPTRFPRGRAGTTSREERAGGARGDSSGGRPIPDAR